MYSLTCPVCNEDFEIDEFPFGSNVACTHCGTELETDYEEDYDNIYGPFVTGVAKKNEK